MVKYVTVAGVIFTALGIVLGSVTIILDMPRVWIALWFLVLGFGIGILLRELEPKPKKYPGFMNYRKLLWPFYAYEPTDMMGSDVHVLRPRCPNCNRELGDHYDKIENNALYLKCPNIQNDKKCSIESYDPMNLQTYTQLLEEAEREIRYQIEKETIFLNKDKDRWEEKKISKSIIHKTFANLDLRPIKFNELYIPNSKLPFGVNKIKL